MNAVGVCILGVTLLVVIFAPRRWALLGMMAGVLFLTEGQKIEVLGFNLFPHRFLEMAGFVRVVVRGEYSFSKLNQIDRVLLLLYTYTTLVFLLRSTRSQAYQIGLAVDAILCYFTFKGLIGDIEDFRWFLRSLILLLGPYLVLVIIEGFTGRNLFAIMGAPEHLFREGRVRCIGSFRHPDLLGTLGASFLPLYIGLASAKTDRARALAGIGLSIGIVLLTNSGGPLACTATALTGWLLWFARRKMLLVRLGLVVIAIFLAFYMSAPIWYLPARVGALTGGTAWHRSYLIEMAVKNLDKWWLAGMSIKETKAWFPYGLEITGGADITNHYLSFGLSAGIGAVALFILLVTFCFRNLGKALKTVRSRSIECRSMLWGLGVALSVHVVNWFGVSYFDQINVIWFMQLAAISNLSQINVKAARGSIGRGRRVRYDLARH